MNWVGGARRRVGLQNEKRTQKEYFQRKQQNKKIRAFQSPEKKNGISQDLLALHTVNIAYSGMPFDKKYPEKRYVRKVDIDRSKLFSREIQEVELPHSPIKTPSTLTLEEPNSCFISSKLTRLNKSSNGKEASNGNVNGLRRQNDSLLSQPYPQFHNFPAKEPHQPKPDQSFNRTQQDKTNEISTLNLLDSCKRRDKTYGIPDRYLAPSFRSSMDLCPSMSSDTLTSPPMHHVALAQSQQLPRGSISDVYNNIGRKWREETKSVHTATYIEEEQHCWQMATSSQRSYISKNTSPFITTLHQLQETRPYSYHEFVCPESPEEFVAIPMGNIQQLYIPSAQMKQETPINTQEYFADKSNLQTSKKTSDFWQIPVYGDFFKEMKIKQSQVSESLMSSTDQSENIETQEDALASKRTENCKSRLMSIQQYDEDEEDPVFNERTSYQMSPESRLHSKQVNVSVQVDLKASVCDASTSPIVWPQSDRASQYDEEEFRLNPTEEIHEDSLQEIFKENKSEISNNLQTFYQLRSRIAVKTANQK